MDMESIYDGIVERMCKFSFGFEIYGDETFVAGLRAALKTMDDSMNMRQTTDVDIKIATDLACDAFGEEILKNKCDERRLCYETAFVMLYTLKENHYDYISSFMFTDLELMLESYPEFETLTIEEQDTLLAFRNYVRITLILATARGNKNHILDLVTRLVEGRDRKYITGSGQSLETSRRVLIYEREGGIVPTPRPRRKKKNATKTNNDSDGTSGDGSSSASTLGPSAMMSMTHNIEHDMSRSGGVGVPNKANKANAAEKRKKSDNRSASNQLLGGASSSSNTSSPTGAKDEEVFEMVMERLKKVAFASLLGNPAHGAQVEHALRTHLPLMSKTIDAVGGNRVTLSAAIEMAEAFLAANAANASPLASNTDVASEGGALTLEVAVSMDETTEPAHAAAEVVVECEGLDALDGGLDRAMEAVVAPKQGSWSEEVQREVRLCFEGALVMMFCLKLSNRRIVEHIMFKNISQLLFHYPEFANTSYFSSLSSSNSSFSSASAPLHDGGGHAHAHERRSLLAFRNVMAVVMVLFPALGYDHARHIMELVTRLVEGTLGTEAKTFSPSPSTAATPPAIVSGDEVLVDVAVERAKAMRGLVYLREGRKRCKNWLPECETGFNERTLIAALGVAVGGLSGFAGSMPGSSTLGDVVDTVEHAMDMHESVMEDESVGPDNLSVRLVRASGSKQQRRKRTRLVDDDSLGSGQRGRERERGEGERVHSRSSDGDDEVDDEEEVVAV